MELQITGKNMELTPAVRQYIERKLGKLDHYLPSIRKASVEIFEEKTKSPQHRYVVQTTVDCSGTVLRGEERGVDLFEAIDRVAAVMNRRIEHYKGKLYARGRSTSPAKGELSAEETQPSPKVVKVKRFAIKPMSVDEAIDQMELLGHDFFLFLNADTEELNLLYHRKDGNYGIIEPELG